MPNKHEISKEIFELAELYKHLPSTNRFGNPYRQAVLLQRQVLVENLSEDAIQSIITELCDDDDYLFAAMMDVRRWLDGKEGYEAPSLNWKCLIS